MATGPRLSASDNPSTRRARRARRQRWLERADGCATDPRLSPSHNPSTRRAWRARRQRWLEQANASRGARVGVGRHRRRRVGARQGGVGRAGAHRGAGRWAPLLSRGRRRRTDRPAPRQAWSPRHGWRPAGPWTPAEERPGDEAAGRRGTSLRSPSARATGPLVLNRPMARSRPMRHRPPWAQPRDPRPLRAARTRGPRPCRGGSSMRP